MRSDGGMTLAVILARAGSKGLPGKNARLLGGKPLLAWTVEHAMGAKCVDRVVVSTDGRELSEIARLAGAEVIDRPAEMAGDEAPVQHAVRHAVLAVEAANGKWVEVVVILYGNVPLRPADLTDRAVTKLKETAADSVQSVCAVGKMHPYWMKRLGGQGGDQLEAYEKNNIYRRQDLPPVYMLDGGIIAVTRESLFQADDQAGPHEFLGRDRRAIVAAPGQVVDVDTASDLALAEALLRKSRSGPART